MLGITETLMTTNVCICQGNIFEGGAHLTVLPASAKGTISSSCQRWVDLFGLNAPPFDSQPVYGGISEVFAFPQPLVSEWYCYAYSVFNDRSSPEVLTEISRALGRTTHYFPETKIVQTPLLGTGAGGLKNDIAAKALVKGFAETARTDSMLCIFVYDAERYKSLQKVFEGTLDRIIDAVDLKLTFMGSGVDFKKLLKR